MFRSSGREPLADFAAAVREEPSRIEQGWAPTWHYVAHGFYHEQLKRYYDLFDSGNIRVYFFEDLKQDSGAVMRDIFSFLGVDDNFEPDLFERHNVTGTPKNARLHGLLSGQSKIRALAKHIVPDRLGRRVLSNLRQKNIERMPKLSKALRAELVSLYRSDIVKLQELTGRDLAAWLDEG